MTHYRAETENLSVTLVEHGEAVRLRVWPTGLEARGLLIRPGDVPGLLKALRGAERALRKLNGRSAGED